MRRFLSVYERERITNFFAVYGGLPDIFEALRSSGATVYAVGGVVRDMLMGRLIKDLDFEVHGIELDVMRNVLAKFGPVALVGKSFGVIKLLGHYQFDWSIPRTDGAGRRPHVLCDPHMGIEQALERRDLTMNAIALDVHTWQLYDPFGGERDIKDRLLRCTSPEKFIEDPLRFFRVMHFMGRFDMVPDELLNEICRSMSLKEIARERIFGEFDKLMLLSRTPSVGIRWLNAVGRIDELLPELAALRFIEQNPKWHPEGNVFEHTMQSIDAMKQIVDERPDLKLFQRRILMYTMLCHDLGKAFTTKEQPDGRITSHGHEEAGVALAKKLMHRLTDEVDLIDGVARLVRHHMAPGSFIENNARPAAYKRLAAKLGSRLNLSLLALVACADRRGRNGVSSEPLTKNPDDMIDTFIALARASGVLDAPEPAILTGKDFEGKIEPGPMMGRMLQRAYEIQINEGIDDSVVLLDRVLRDESL